MLVTAGEVHQSGQSTRSRALHDNPVLRPQKFFPTQLVNVAVSKSPTKTNVKELRTTLAVAAVSCRDSGVTILLFISHQLK